MIEYQTKLPELSIKYKSGDCYKAKITKSSEAYELFKRLYDKDTIEYQESVILLLFNRANTTIGWIKLSIGGMTGTIMDTKIIFAVALKAGAHSIMISHNHPSGQLFPSNSDKEITKNLVAAGKIMDINLLDHIIVTNDAYYSFADEGILNVSN